MGDSEEYLIQPVAPEPEVQPIQPVMNFDPEPFTPIEPISFDPQPVQDVLTPDPPAFDSSLFSTPSNFSFEPPVSQDDSYSSPAFDSYDQLRNDVSEEDSGNYSTISAPQDEFPYPDVFTETPIAYEPPREEEAPQEWQPDLTPELESEPETALQTFSGWPQEDSETTENNSETGVDLFFANTQQDTYSEPASGADDASPEWQAVTGSSSDDGSWETGTAHAQEGGWGDTATVTAEDLPILPAGTDDAGWNVDEDRVTADVAAGTAAVSNQADGTNDTGWNPNQELVAPEVTANAAAVPDQAYETNDSVWNGDEELIAPDVTANAAAVSADPAWVSDDTMQASNETSQPNLSWGEAEALDEAATAEEVSTPDPSAGRGDPPAEDSQELSASSQTGPVLQEEAIVAPDPPTEWEGSSDAGWSAEIPTSMQEVSVFQDDPTVAPDPPTSWDRSPGLESSEVVSEPLMPDSPTVLAALPVVETPQVVITSVQDDSASQNEVVAPDAPVVLEAPIVEETPLSELVAESGPANASTMEEADGTTASAVTTADLQEDLNPPAPSPEITPAYGTDENATASSQTDLTSQDFPNIAIEAEVLEETATSVQIEPASQDDTVLPVPPASWDDAIVPEEQMGNSVSSAPASDWEQASSVESLDSVTPLIEVPEDVPVPVEPDAIPQEELAPSQVAEVLEEAPQPVILETPDQEEVAEEQPAPVPSAQEPDQSEQVLETPVAESVPIADETFEMNSAWLEPPSSEVAVTPASLEDQLDLQNEAEETPASSTEPEAAAVPLAVSDEWETEAAPVEAPSTSPVNEETQEASMMDAAFAGEGTASLTTAESPVPTGAESASSEEAPVETDQPSLEQAAEEPAGQMDELLSDASEAVASDTVSSEEIAPEVAVQEEVSEPIATEAAAQEVAVEHIEEGTDLPWDHTGEQEPVSPEMAPSAEETAEQLFAAWTDTAQTQEGNPEPAADADLAQENTSPLQNWIDLSKLGKPEEAPVAGGDELALQEEIATAPAAEETAADAEVITADDVSASLLSENAAKDSMEGTPASQMDTGGELLETRVDSPAFEEARESSEPETSGPAFTQENVVEPTAAQGQSSAETPKSPIPADAALVDELVTENSPDLQDAPETVAEGMLAESALAAAEALTEGHPQKFSGSDDGSQSNGGKKQPKPVSHGNPSSEDATSKSLSETGRRNAPGKSPESPRTSNQTSTWLGLLPGTKFAGNAVTVPQKLADRLAGREFKNFNTNFKEAFWKEVAKDPELASAFSYDERNLKRMSNGNAPFVQLQHQAVLKKDGEQWKNFRSGTSTVDDKLIGTGQDKVRQVYNLHHQMPAYDDKNKDKFGRTGFDRRYDPSNILVITPRYHQTVLDPDYHYDR